jgi:hypothetical protein
VNNRITTRVEHVLTDHFTKIECIPGLKTTLFQHQKTVVRAMLDLEMNRTFDLNNIRTVYKYNLSTSAGVLSEAVGSGKTIDILSVILVQKIPKVLPGISEIQMYPINDSNTLQNSLTNKFVGVIRKKFRNILKTTIVFVGVSVINQWITSVKTFTTLKYFTVCNVIDLQNLINIMSDKSVNNYDIIIVKNGKVSRPVIFPPGIKTEYKNKRTSIPIYNIIANMRNFCWARVVIDDFDTIKLPYDAGIVNGLFTWYISSTRKHMPIRTCVNTQFKTTSDMLMYSNYNCGNIMKNQSLFYNLNIRNSESFVETSNNINSPTFYAYTYANNNNQYIGLLGLIGTEETNEIMEMLNSDAIETAAERIGIKTTNVTDIFERILGDQFVKYKTSVDVLLFIDDVEPLQGLRTPMSGNPNPNDTYKKSDLFVKREINFNYPNLKALLDSTKIEYTKIKQETGIGIERVKNNIKDGECPICSSDLNDVDEEIIIAKCCGVMICGTCCFGTIFLPTKTTGQCSNCRSPLKLFDLIYLNKCFNLNRIVNDGKGDDGKDDDCKDDDCKDDDESPIKPAFVHRTKTTAIIEIIKGIIPSERQHVDVNIHNLMKGSYVLPNIDIHKVLIFANYDETLYKIKTALDEENICYWGLGGTHNEIANTVAEFTNCTSTCVLIINSMKHCSGLNLQTATDLIFAHKIIDPNIETQVIGRGQRLGRTTTLRVHYLMYKNEYERMINNNEIREIDDI